MTGRLALQDTYSTLPRLLYTFILYFLTPWVLLRLAWRGLRAPAYWRRWPERFGFLPSMHGTGCRKRPEVDARETLWIHAVSVGETQAALPLIKALQQHYPHMTLVVTTTTPTGSERVRAALGDTVFHVYAPYDLPGAVRRFLSRTRPRVAIIMETELWPNLIHGCQQRGIPVIVANARLSARSAAGYQRVAGLTREALQSITVIAAQAQADAQRFIALGADPARVRVTGNIKFDITPAADLPQHAAALRHSWGAQRPVWIAASTHANASDSEDEQVLAAFATVRLALPNALLILVPRHPERFAKVAALCRKQGYNIVLRSEQKPYDTTPDAVHGWRFLRIPAPTALGHPARRTSAAGAGCAEATAVHGCTSVARGSLQRILRSRHSSIHGQRRMPEATIYIGDSMGELMLFYAASDVAFVGGSLIRHGGHNLLEPAALGIPVITGPHTFNFADISRMLLQADAARQVDNPAELAAAVITLLQNDTLRRAMGEKGRDLVEQNRGALAKLIAIVHEHC